MGMRTRRGILYDDAMAIEESTGGGLTPEQARRYTRRGFLKLAGAAGLAIGLGGGLADLLAACGNSAATGTSAGGSRIQLVYQDWRTDWFPPMAQEMLGQVPRHAPQHPTSSTCPTPRTRRSRCSPTCRPAPRPTSSRAAATTSRSGRRRATPSTCAPTCSATSTRRRSPTGIAAQYRALFTRTAAVRRCPSTTARWPSTTTRTSSTAYGCPTPTVWTHDDYLAAMKRSRATETTTARPTSGAAWSTSPGTASRCTSTPGAGTSSTRTTDAVAVMASPRALAALEWLRARMWDDQVMATPHDVQQHGHAARRSSPASWPWSRTAPGR